MWSGCLFNLFWFYSFSKYNIAGVVVVIIQKTQILQLLNLLLPRPSNPKYAKVLHQHTPTHTNQHQHTPTNTNQHQHTPTHTNQHRHTPTNTDTHQPTPTHTNTHQHTLTHSNKHQPTPTNSKETTNWQQSSFLFVMLNRVWPTSVNIHLFGVGVRWGGVQTPSSYWIKENGPQLFDIDDKIKIKSANIDRTMASKIRINDPLNGTPHIQH